MNANDIYEHGIFNEDMKENNDLTGKESSQWDEDDKIVFAVEKYQKKAKRLKKALKKAKKRAKAQKGNHIKCKKKDKKRIHALKKDLKKLKSQNRELENFLNQERFRYNMENRLLRQFIALSVPPDKIGAFKSINQNVPERFYLEDKRHEDS